MDVAGIGVRAGLRARAGGRLAVIVVASGMGPLRPGERFRPGSQADDMYWRLARR